MLLLHGDCLEKMKDLSSNSVDIVIADLPYGRFKHLKWDTPIDLAKMWKQLNRICKKTTPIFLFGDMKFGVELINSNPKFFKWELVWNKLRTTTPLLSRRRPGKATEYVFVFYRKQCVYNYAKYHKIKKSVKQNNKIKKSEIQPHYPNSVKKHYDPKLPTNVIWKGSIANGGNKMKCIRNEYDPTLPTNVIQEKTFPNRAKIIGGKKMLSLENNRYEPTLPTNVIKKPRKWGGSDSKELHNNDFRTLYTPEYKENVKNYEPRLPTNVLNTAVKQSKKLIKNITEKPQFLLEFLLKYFSNEDDVVLDFCMGSGSCGVACATLKRNFIGIELNKEHFKIAKKRLMK